MSFVAPLAAVPILTRATMNAINGQLKPLSREIRPEHAKWRERLCLRTLKSAEFVILSAIVSRTLGWTKMIEVIPFTQFSKGLTDSDGNYTVYDDMPIFVGTGLDSKTISKALAGLQNKGMICRFSFPSGGRETYAYMPISAFVLAELLEHLPQHDVLPPTICEAIRRDPKTGNLISTPHEVYLVAACTRQKADLSDWNAMSEDAA